MDVALVNAHVHFNTCTDIKTTHMSRGILYMLTNLDMDVPCLEVVNLGATATPQVRIVHTRYICVTQV